MLAAAARTISANLTAWSALKYSKLLNDTEGHMCGILDPKASAVVYYRAECSLIEQPRVQ